MNASDRVDQAFVDASMNDLLMQIFDGITDTIREQLSRIGS